MQNLDIFSVSRLAIAGDYATALTQLAQVEYVSPGLIVASPFACAAIGRLVVHGGDRACRVIWESMRRSGSVNEGRRLVSPEDVTKTLFRAAISACNEAIVAGRHSILEDHFHSAANLPHANVKRSAVLIGVFRRQLSRAQAVQAKVLALHAERRLPALLTMGVRHHLTAVVGATAELRMVDTVLRLAGAASGYSTLGQEMLALVMGVAAWPMTARLMQVTEIIYVDILTAWWLSPELRRDFTYAAMDWIKTAICIDNDDLGQEPADAFADDG